MRRWWCKKYTLPPTSPLFLAYTAEELWIEYFEDYYEKHPTTDIDESDITPDDRVQLVTGDPGIDKVEAMLAEETVDEEAIMREIESWESGTATE